MFMNYNAETIEDAKQNYLIHRYKELASIGIVFLNEIYYEEKAIISNYSDGSSSIYILNQYRGQGLYIKLLQIFMPFIITMNYCDITGYLDKIKCNYRVVSPSPAYLKIKELYSDKRTNRSQVKLMNHIDEGIQILNSIGANQDTLDAYCLHPIFQSDTDFNNNINMDYSSISTKALLLAVEYRRVANSYLSTMQMSDFIGFTNNEIKQMLYADKIQNEKDFRLYHEGKHSRSIELREYFDNWINILLK